MPRLPSVSTLSSPTLPPLETPVFPATTFAEPWEAQAFALVVSLHERGLFAWPEWGDALADEIARAPDAPYYESWLTALEALLAHKNIRQRGPPGGDADAWAQAAAATPHGSPIDLAEAVGLRRTHEQQKADS